MKSNICEITNDKDSLLIIMDETEKCASYNNLDPKQARTLRLLAEELTGMLPELVVFSKGRFWVENTKNRFEIHTTMDVDRRDLDYRERLLSISTSGKNAAAKGIMGKIREMAESMADYYNAAGQLGMAPLSPLDDIGCYASQQYAFAWSLANYRNQVEDQCAATGSTEEWDELERSIIANIADDVVVGIQGSIVHIIIRKRFG